MSEKTIRILVVDDSAVMREVLRRSIQTDPAMKVVATAADGREALEQIEVFQPDVVTLDVQMPTMNGLEALDAILARNPLPVIMVSALTGLGTKTTLDAIDRGAIDCILKPDIAADRNELFCDELLRKIRSSAGIDVRRIMAIRRERKARLSQSMPVGKSSLDYPAEEMNDFCVALGISTGGPPALALLFGAMRPPMPGIVCVQHMPPGFTGPLASRLDGLSQLSIREAQSGDVVRPNQVLIAPAGRHLLLRRKENGVAVVLNDGLRVSGHKPSIDVAMQSAAEVYGPKCLGVIMTGMGRDGVDGCAAIRAAGGYVLGQDEASSDVYGMNKVAYESGAVDRQFSLENAVAVIEQEIRQIISRNSTNEFRAADAEAY